jgi:hypothetical protein
MAAVMTATTNGSATTVPTAPYSRAPTRACLIRDGARLVSGVYSIGPIPRYPEIVTWLELSVRKYGRVFVLFATNDARATMLEQRYKQVGHAFGATDGEIRGLIVRHRNVVYTGSPSTTFAPIPSTELATLDHCLH